MYVIEDHSTSVVVALTLGSLKTVRLAKSLAASARRDR